MTDQDKIETIYSRILHWPAHMDLREFNDRLLQLCMDLHEQLGLYYWPRLGKMPAGLTTHGWYMLNEKGGWQIVLPDDNPVTWANLFGVTITLEGGKVFAFDIETQRGTYAQPQDNAQILISVPEAQKILDIKARQTIYKMIETGQLEGVKIGGRWKVTRESLRELIGKDGNK